MPKILDERGNLSFFENSNQIPFDIKRTYWIDNACADNKETFAIARTENDTGISNNNKLVRSGEVPDRGLYSYIQLLKIVSEDKPSLLIEEIENCLYEENCVEERTFSITASDCFGNTDLDYQYELFENQTSLVKRGC